MARIPWVYLIRWVDYAPAQNALERAFRVTCNVMSIPVKLSRIDLIRAKLAKPMAPGANGYSSTMHPRRRGVRELIGPFVERASAKLFDRVSIRDSASGKFLPQLPDLILNNDTWKAVWDLDSFRCEKAFIAADATVSVRRYITIGQAHKYDHVFVSQKRLVKPFKDHGCRNAYWLPVGCQDEVFRRPRPPEIYDVSFAGALYPNHPRTLYLMALKKNFNLHLGRAFQHDLAEMYRRSKIVFHRSFAGELNIRIFEAMGAGSLVVCDRCDGLFDLFEDGKHLVSYENVNDLAEKISYYLRHDEERRAIARRGQEEVLSKHTYLNRAREVLRTTLGEEIQLFN